MNLPGYIVRVRGVQIAGLVFAFLSGVVQGAERFPPVGERVYILEIKGEKRFSRVKVVPDRGVKNTGKIVLRDPVLNTGLGQEDEKVRKKKLMISEKSSYTLTPLTVRAAFQKPQIPFKNIEVIIDRADQPIQDNFLHKIDKDLPEL